MMRSHLNLRIAARTDAFRFAVSGTWTGWAISVPFNQRLYRRLIPGKRIFAEHYPGRRAACDTAVFY